MNKKNFKSDVIDQKVNNGFNEVDQDENTIKYDKVKNTNINKKTSNILNIKDFSKDENISAIFNIIGNYYNDISHNIDKIKIKETNFAKTLEIFKDKKSKFPLKFENFISKSIIEEELDITNFCDDSISILALISFFNSYSNKKIYDVFFQKYLCELIKSCIRSTNSLDYQDQDQDKDKDQDKDQDKDHNDNVLNKNEMSNSSSEKLFQFKYKLLIKRVLVLVNLFEIFFANFILDDLISTLSNNYQEKISTIISDKNNTNSNQNKQYVQNLMKKIFDLKDMNNLNESTHYKEMISLTERAIGLEFSIFSKIIFKELTSCCLKYINKVSDKNILIDSVIEELYCTYFSDKENMSDILFTNDSLLDLSGYVQDYENSDDENISNGNSHLLMKTDLKTNESITCEKFSFSSINIHLDNNNINEIFKFIENYYLY